MGVSRSLPESPKRSSRRRSVSAAVLARCELNGSPTEAVRGALRFTAEHCSPTIWQESGRPFSATNRLKRFSETVLSERHVPQRKCLSLSLRESINSPHRGWPPAGQNVAIAPLTRNSFRVNAHNTNGIKLPNECRQTSHGGRSLAAPVTTSRGTRYILPSDDPRRTFSAACPRQTTESSRVCPTQSITVPTRVVVGSLRKALNQSGTLKKGKRVHIGVDVIKSRYRLLVLPPLFQRDETVNRRTLRRRNKGVPH